MAAHLDTAVADRDNNNREEDIMVQCFVCLVNETVMMAAAAEEF